MFLVLDLPQQGIEGQRPSHEAEERVFENRPREEQARVTPGGEQARVKGDKGGLLTVRLLFMGLCQDREVLD